MGKQQTVNTVGQTTKPQTVATVEPTVRQVTGTTTKTQNSATIKSLAPTAEWLLIRDKIRVNDDLSKELAAEIASRKLKPGTTLGLMAREIVHDTSYKLHLEGFPLLLVADFYDGNKGSIDTNGAAGAAGAKGGTGKQGTATQTTSVEGGRGGNGQAGAAGAAASPITLIAATIQSASLSAVGGAGGAGGNGGAGGSGAAGKTGRPGKFDTIEPTNGGPGGNGGDGGAGGSGGQITVHYVNLKGSLNLNGNGGGGGVKGQGGAAGLRGNGVASKNVSPGKAGAAGAVGKTVAAVKTQHQQGKWSSAVLPAIGNAADVWAEYRTRVGEYAFRRHTSKTPKEGNVVFREFARNEFLAARSLSPKIERATRLLHYLDGNLCPLGVPYDHDVMPDFDSFEKVVTDYGPWIQQLFSDAQRLLKASTDAQYRQVDLKKDIASIGGRREALELEAQAKDQEEEIALKELEQSKVRLKANQNAIEANRAEQAKKRLEAQDDFFYGTLAEVAAVIVAVAGAVYTGGASLSLIVAAAGLLQKADSALYEDPEGMSLFKDGKGVADLFSSSNGKPELKQEFKDMAGGLKEMVEKTTEFIDKFKAVEDLMAAKVDGELESAEKELLIKQLDLTAEVNLCGLKQKQVVLERAALEKELETAGHDYELVTQLKDSVGKNIQALGKVTWALIRQAQGYADILTKYRFYATRAFDLWTLGSRTSSFAFDRGLLHPDAVESAFQAMARGDGTRAQELAGQYIAAWATLPDLVKLRDEFDDYSAPPNSEPLVTDKWFYNFPDPASPSVVESLKKHRSATFRTGLPAGRSEAKILNVAVSLVGAKADDPSVTVVVEHTGDATARLRGGKTVRLRQPPRREPISATFDASDLGDLDEVERQQFWGRSPAAVWRISIDEESAANSKLDLSGLTEVQLAVYYKCFFN